MQESFSVDFHEKLPMTWAEIGYQVVLTADASPSLRSTQSERAEAMHHLKGAWSETRYIYQSVVSAAKDLGAKRFLSVGLGLGYNELLVLKTFLQAPENSFLMSFESDPWLSKNLLLALNEFAKNSNPTANEILNTYFTIFKLLQIETTQATAILKLYENGQWQIQGALNAQNSFAEAKDFLPFEVILFDAYSRMTSPELWAGSLLAQIEAHMAKQSVFTTYACTGDLRRFFLEKGFEFYKRPGFSGKRDSSLASRGWSMQIFADSSAAVLNVPAASHEFEI